MKIRKWVDMGQEVEIEIGSDDIRCALAEAFSRDTDTLGEEPDRGSILRTFNSIGAYFKALNDEQIAALNPQQRAVVLKFLKAQVARFEAVPEEREKGR